MQTDTKKFWLRLHSINAQGYVTFYFNSLQYHFRLLKLSNRIIFCHFYAR